MGTFICAMSFSGTNHPKPRDPIIKGTNGLRAMAKNSVDGSEWPDLVSCEKWEPFIYQMRQLDGHTTSNTGVFVYPAWRSLVNLLMHFVLVG